MFAVIIQEKGGQPRRQDFTKAEVTIGRVQGNDIILPKQNVSKRHSRIVVKDGKFIIVDLKSTNGTYVNGRKIASPMVIKETDKIYIGDFTMTVEASAEMQDAAPDVALPPEPPRPAMPPARPAMPSPPTPAPVAVPPPVVPARPAPPMPPSPVSRPVPRPVPAARLPEPPVAPTPPPQPAPPVPAAAPAYVPSLAPPAAPMVAPSAPAAPIAAVPAPTPGDLGPIGPLMDDPGVQSLFLDGPGRLTVVGTNGASSAQAGLHSAEAISQAAATLFAQAGITLHQGFSEVLLASGFRLHYAGPGVGGPYLTIERMHTARRDLRAMVAEGVLSPNIAAFLSFALKLGRGLVVASNDIDARLELIGALAQTAEGARIIAVDEGGHFAGQFVNLSAGSGHDSTEVIRQALRMRPDRLLVPDCKGPETFLALTALAGSVNGGILGLTAESTDDAMIRLVRQASIANQSDDERLKGLLFEATDVLVQLLRYADGRCMVIQVLDLDGQPVEVFSNFKATGHIPRWVQNAQRLGHEFDLSLFS